MARRVFFSFHHNKDCWRTSQVRNIGKVDGSKSASDNDWEAIKKGGELPIKRWIDDQMIGRTCVVVLVGSETAGRPWIEYEILKAWNEKKGLLGINIHNLKHSDGKQSWKGENPFDNFIIEKGVVRKKRPFSFDDFFAKQLSSVLKVHNPPFSDSKEVYKYIAENIGDWVEEGIALRYNYKI